MPTQWRNLFSANFYRMYPASSTFHPQCQRKTSCNRCFRGVLQAPVILEGPPTQTVGRIKRTRLLPICYTLAVLKAIGTTANELMSKRVCVQQHCARRHAERWVLRWHLIRHALACATQVDASINEFSNVCCHALFRLPSTNHATNEPGIVLRYFIHSASHWVCRFQ